MSLQKDYFDSYELSEINYEEDISEYDLYSNYPDNKRFRRKVEDYFEKRRLREELEEEWEHDDFE